MSSCENSDISFPDYDGGISVYFPYQYPIRTITLGDITTYDNSKENNEHKFTIYSTMGGSYTGKDIKVDFKVDESLVEGLTFQDGTPVKAMPSDYYTLSGNTLDYGGTFRGGVDVQLNDAFFADPASVKTTYVIPLMMTQATGAQRILDLSSATPIPALVGQTVARTDVDSWVDGPRDFTLFCVNYINKYDGNYLRRGTDDVAEYVKKKDNTFLKIPIGDQVERPWDNQFWIITNTPYKLDDTWEISMKIKADKEATVATQTHNGNPGNYVHWYAVGNVPFTTEWQEFKANGTITPDQKEGDNFILAFNLNTGPDPGTAEDANTYYFDDISFKLNGKEVVVNGNCEGSETQAFVTKSNIGEKAGQMVSSEFESTYVILKDEVAKTNSVTRQKEFIESDEVVKVSTKTLNTATLPVKVAHTDGMPVTCDLLLTFDGDKCSISIDPDSESAAKGYTATGTGEFKSKSEIKAWGNKDRDGLYLNYTIDLGDCKYTSEDVLVARDRGNAGSIQTFKPIYTQK